MPHQMIIGIFIGLVGAIWLAGLVYLFYRNARRKEKLKADNLKRATQYHERRNYATKSR